MTEKLQTPEADPSKHTHRSVSTRSLFWSAWGLGLAIVACIVGYQGGFMGTVLCAFIPALVIAGGAALLLIWILVHASMAHPGATQAAPLFLGMVTFSLATLIGSVSVVPAIYERHVESLRSPAVEAVERHRQHTGAYPASDDDPEGLPDEVSYGRVGDGDDNEVGNAYILSIEDRFSWFSAWLYDSRTKQWTYRSD